MPQHENGAQSDKDDASTQKTFADTTIGKIVIGLVVALVPTAIGSGLTWYFTKNSVPVVNIAPNQVSAEALAETNFSAENSHDPEGENLSFTWYLNGQPFGTSPVANCNHTNEVKVIKCRFLMPGSHTVTIRATDESGLTGIATATVQVDLAGGYLGLFIATEGDATARAAIETALLYGIDWVEIQTLVKSPIVLYDPDANSTIYASTINRNLAKAKQATENSNVANVKISMAGLSQEVQGKIILQAYEAGFSVTPIYLRFNEVITASERGATDGGFVQLSSPNGLLKAKNMM